MHKYARKLAWHKVFSTLPAKSNYKKALSTIFAIFIAIIAVTIFVGILGYDPKDFIHRLFTRWVGSYDIYLNKVAVAGIAALSFIFAFKAGLFNIGISGQMLAAGLIMIVVVRHLQISHLNVPIVVGQILLFIIAAAAGALVTVFIGILKIFLKINEVVSSILLNWMIYFLAKYTILKSNNGLYAQNASIPQGSATIQWNFTLDGLAPGYGYLFALGIFVLVAVIVFILLRFTVFGQKVLSVGRSFEASRYAGYKTKTIAIATFAISGMIAGILGFVLYTANSQGQAIAIKENVDILPNEGFDGIAIGLIALVHPLAVIPISFLVGMLQFSADYLGGSFPSEVSGLIISFIMIGAAMFVLFEKISPIYLMFKWIYAKKGLEDYKHYENELNSIISTYNGTYVRLKKAHKDALKAVRINTTKTDNPQRVRYLQQLINQYYNALYNQEYLAYVNAVEKNYKQLRKHLLIQKVNQVFFPEQRILHKAKIFHHRLSLRESKKLSNLRDKIYLDQQNLLKFAFQNLKRYAEKIGFDYNEYLAYLRKNPSVDWLINEENRSSYKNIFLNSTYQKLINQKNMSNDDWVLLQEQTDPTIYINAMDEDVKGVYELLVYKQKITHEQWVHIANIMSNRDPHFKQVWNIYLKNYNTYQELLNQEDKTIQEAKKYMHKHLRLSSTQKIKQTYETSLNKIKQIKLDNKQNQLLLTWLQTSYEQALNVDQQQIIERAVI
ncbi:ABC transporter permease [Ureaplasma sp. ES3154-GEN]|uniref:ABC transporter permease n=1 Tax=Ureaplasma sp. ES3154-GEN TaxID=2984844 RepID=UPI0021E98D35|nr:ABC transporter permease [Ureaplasma sp. ES3154-GEN]MCV3743739.1 ABC transporter permease [Ureaplasma sp. ES3154-GEN]